MTRRNLIQVLGFVQNSTEHEHRDIMTWATFCETDSELAEHVFKCWRQVKNPERRLDLVKYARSLAAA